MTPRITGHSRLSQVAASVAKALEDAGIRAVLSGGACASLYTRGTYQSSDLDFVLQSAVAPAALDAAMAAAGFRRTGNHYVHPHTAFFVEFPAGPLAIGNDIRVQPVEYRVRRHVVRALSATDSCRDRLAAFFFWNDRQSLRVAVSIAKRHPVDLDVIRDWSAAEGKTTAFEEFEKTLVRETKTTRRRSMPDDGRR